VGRDLGRPNRPPTPARSQTLKLEGHQKRLTIFIGESVLRGVEGYGASNRIHTTRILSLSDDLPIAVIIVDTDERIQAFLPGLDELITEGLVILDDVEVVKYAGRPAKGNP